jgi:hypothetical protein
MKEEGWSPKMRERTIRSVIASQAMSGLAVPLHVGTEAFDDALFRSLPKIGERDE